MQENAGAAYVDFSKEDETEVRKMLDQVGGAKGARYPAAIMDVALVTFPSSSFVQLTKNENRHLSATMVNTATGQNFATSSSQNSMILASGLLD